MALNSSDPSTKTQMTWRNWATDNRRFFRQYYDAKSEWVNLTKGEPHAIEATQHNYHGSDHMAVGVEIERENSTGHHHAMKEVQYVSYFDSNAAFETTRITIDNPESAGNFKINFKSPANKYVASSTIPADATAT